MSTGAAALEFTGDASVGEHYAEEIIAAGQAMTHSASADYCGGVLLDEVAGLGERDWPDNRAVHG